MENRNLNKKLTEDILRSEGERINCEEFYSEVYTDIEGNSKFYIADCIEGQRLDDVFLKYFGPSGLLKSSLINNLIEIKEECIPDGEYINVFKCAIIGKTILVLNKNESSLKLPINSLHKLNEFINYPFELYRY